MKEGSELLDEEKPIGDTPAKVQEQMETCQVRKAGNRELASQP